MMRLPSFESCVMPVLYSLAIYLLTPVFVLHLLVRSRREPAYRVGWWRRLAIAQKKPTIQNGRRIWFHAVSVGEVLAIAPIIEQFLAQDDYAVLVTTTTPTGAREVRRLFGNRVDHAWTPIDAGLVVRCFFNHWRPALVALVETELWPNIVTQAKGRKVPVMLVNARMSKRSARGYAKFGCLFRHAFRGLDGVMCQGRADARRLVALGVNPLAVTVVDSVKFEINAITRKQQGEMIGQELGMRPDRPIVVAGSMHPEEQTTLLDAMDLLWRKLPETLLIIAPRHLRSVPALTQMLGNRGIDYSLRSATGQTVSDVTRVLVLDTFGELGSIYSLAMTAIIGGTLYDRGGHNPLEAIALGVPVIAGTSTFNFAGIYRDLVAAGSCRLVSDSVSLAEAVALNLVDERQRQQAATAGLDYFATRAGAAGKQMELIASFLPSLAH